jgi:hypothetical protein
MAFLQSACQLDEDVVTSLVSYRKPGVVGFTRSSSSVTVMRRHVSVYICQQSFVGVDALSSSVEIALLKKLIEEAQRFCKASRGLKWRD